MKSKLFCGYLWRKQNICKIWEKYLKFSSYDSTFDPKSNVITRSRTSFMGPLMADSPFSACFFFFCIRVGCRFLWGPCTQLLLVLQLPITWWKPVCWKLFGWRGFFIDEKKNIYWKFWDIFPGLQVGKGWDVCISWPSLLLILFAKAMYSVFLPVLVCLLPWVWDWLTYLICITFNITYNQTIILYHLRNSQ